MSKRKHNQYIERIKNGDSDALWEIYEEFRLPCIKYIMRLHSINEKKAASIFNDVLLKLYINIENDKLEPFKYGNSLKRYLKNTAKNMFLEQTRGAYKEKPMSYDPQNLLDGIVGDDPEEREKLKEFYEKSAKKFNQLDKKCKSILTDFYVYKFSMEEIAEKHDFSDAKSAKNAKYKCMKKLDKL